MQAKRHMAKLIKVSSKFPSWKTLKDSEIRLRYSYKNSEKISGQTAVGNKEIDLGKKNLLSWQNILKIRQITADIEEKLANQGEIRHGGISRIYLSLLNKWKPSHAAMNNRPVNFRTALESTFNFKQIVNKLRVEARSSLVNCEIYSQFSLKLYVQF